MGRRAALIVLDTHVWLWWSGRVPALSAAAEEALGGAERIGIATFSCWEVAMLVRQRRIRLDLEPLSWVRRALAVERVEPLPLAPDVAVAAALLPSAFPGDPADRVIYATALDRGARLLTKDRRLRDFDPELTLW